MSLFGKAGSELVKRGAKKLIKKDLVALTEQGAKSALKYRTPVSEELAELDDPLLSLFRDYKVPGPLATDHIEGSRGRQQSLIEDSPEFTLLGEQLGIPDAAMTKYADELPDRTLLNQMQKRRLDISEALARKPSGVKQPQDIEPRSLEAFDEPPPDEWGEAATKLHTKGLALGAKYNDPELDVAVYDNFQWAAEKRLADEMSQNPNIPGHAYEISDEDIVVNFLDRISTGLSSIESSYKEYLAMKMNIDSDKFKLTFKEFLEAKDSAALPDTYDLGQKKPTKKYDRKGKLVSASQPETDKDLYKQAFQIDEEIPF